MGTNFYAKPKGKYCKNCDFEGQHLGKSSVGWKFHLHANGFEFYKNWEEMKVWLEGKQIFDEYGEKFALKEFIKRVEDKQKVVEPKGTGDWGYVTIEGFKFYESEFC